MDHIETDMELLDRPSMPCNARPVNFSQGVKIQDLQMGVDFEIPEDSQKEANSGDEELLEKGEPYFDGEEMFRNLRFDYTHQPDEDEDSSLTPFEKLAQSMQNVTADKKVLKKVLREGAGELVPEGVLCKLHYNGYLEYQDEPFDSSRLRKKVHQFRLGRGEVIRGWDIGVRTMRKDEIAKFLVYHEYAYGKMGCPPRIPPEAVVLFEIELISWVDNEAAAEYSKLPSEGRRAKTFQEMLQVVHGEREMGNEHFLSHHYGKAARCYATAVRLMEGIFLKDEEEEKVWRADLVRLKLNQALVSLRQVNSRAALRFCKEVFENDPNSVKAFYRSGQAHKQLGEFEKAKENFLIALKSAPKNPEIRREIEDLNRVVSEHKAREKNIYRKMFHNEKSQEPLRNKLSLSDLKVPEDFVLELKITLRDFAEDGSRYEINLPSTFTEEECLAAKLVADDLDLRVALPDFRQKFSCRIFKRVNPLDVSEYY